MTSPGLRPPSLTCSVPVASSLICIGTGLAALLGWQSDVAPLKSVLPGLVAMNPATALALILSGASIILLQDDRPSAGTAGYALAGLVLAIALARLSDLFLGSSFGIDQFLYQSKLVGQGGFPPNHMAPNTAFNFVLIATALLTLALDFKPVGRVPQFVVLLPLGLSLLAMLGYALDVRALYGVGTFIPMALNTALAQFTLSLGILFLYPYRGIARVLVANDMGGVLARRLMPGAILVPALLAWGQLHAHRAGWFEFEPGVSAMVFCCIVVLSAFIWATAARVSRADQERKEAQTQLQLAHAQLESRVVERTAELASANQRLREEVEEHSRTVDRYRLLFAGNPHPMWVYDRTTLQFLAVNDAAVELYGFSVEEFMGMTITQIRPQEDVPALLSDVAGTRPGLSVAREWRHCRKDGSVFSAEVSSHVLQFDGRDAVLVLARDVSNRKLLESQLRQSQKMDAVGKLAGGVAHDFNNLLTAILGQSQLIRKLYHPSPQINDGILEIEKAANRAAGLTRQLLAFSRQQVLQPQVLDLNRTIHDMERMLHRLIGENIQIITARGADLGAVQADPGQLEQVVLNLVVNARDAMPQGGKIVLETANMELDAGYARARAEVEPGRYVMLAVSDTGCGMSPEVTARIFEPFFTTKEAGQGTGLGLSTVHGIVKQSGGHIEVYSEVGHGTTFKIYLPRLKEAAKDVQDAEAMVEQLNGTETIVLVEDEEGIRRILEQVLTISGYTVTTARDGMEAISICESQPRLDLLITDVVMPQMSGPDLVQRVLRSRPGLRVLFMSGYTDQALLQQGLQTPGASFLQKPFTPDALLRAVRDMFDSAHDRAA